MSMCQFESKNSAKLTSIAQNLVNLAWYTDDSTEETTSGKRTAHITGGIIIQR